MQTGEDIEHFALGLRGVADAVGRDQREAERAGKFDGGLIARFLFAVVVALQFDEDVAVAKDADEVFERFTAAFCAKSAGQRTFFAAGETKQTGRVFGEIRARRIHVQVSQKTAEIPVSGAGFDQQRAACPVRHGDLGAYVGLDAELFSRRSGNAESRKHHRYRSAPWPSSHARRKGPHTLRGGTRRAGN